MWHNEIRDITAHLLTETCHDVMTEAPLQELSDETMSYHIKIYRDLIELYERDINSEKSYNRTFRPKAFISC